MPVAVRDHTRMASPETPSRFLRKPAVVARVGMSGVTIWRLQKRGDFPQSIRISPGAVAWREADVEAWIAARVAEAGR